MSRIKRFILILVLLVVFMFVIPIITANTVKADAGMLVVLIFFFVINPLLSVIIGIISGADICSFWFSPLLIGMLFWIFSSVTYRIAFPFIYSVAYLIITSVAMVITHFIKNKKA